MANRKPMNSSRAAGALAVLVVLALSLMVPSFAWAATQIETNSVFAPTGLTTQAGSTVDTATSIALNAKRSGIIGEYGGQDWYKVKLTAAGKFQIQFSGTYRDGGSWNISLRDADNTEMWETGVEARDCLASKTVTLHTTGLAAGTYYLCVTGWYVDNLSYRLTPTFAAVGDWEREWNDTVEVPNALALDKAVNGTSKTYGDQDWYKLKLPASGKFQIKFSGIYNDGGSWNISLRDADNTEMWETGVEARDCLASRTITLHTTGLKAGTYYLCVTGWYVDSVAYKLTPVFAKSSTWEREWNDTVETPNALALNKTVSGTSKTYGDEDWYKFTLPAGGKFQIKFSGKYHNEGSWNISLFDANNSQVGDDYTYDGTTKASKDVIVRALKKGTYYVRVRGWYVDSVTYKLTPTYYVNNTKVVSPVRAKKAITVKWKKVSGVAKYQVRYSLKKNMKGAKKVDASKKTTSKKIKGLKSKRTYYVQVRAVKKIGGVYYYSSWSTKKAIKTK